MNIEEGLQNRKNELENLEKDIKNLDDQAFQIKDHVTRYNDLKKQSSDLKKILKHKTKELDTVISFFSKVDENYITKIFPLFANMPVGGEEESQEDKKGFAFKETAERLGKDSAFKETGEAIGRGLIDV